MEIGNKVLEEWGMATPDDKLIFNLAATVECAPSNHYADMVSLFTKIRMTALLISFQVEYFSTHINHRDSVTLSIHPHNDRGKVDFPFFREYIINYNIGTAVAAAELGLLAGGDRIEGCLLGNGERTGNVDLITLALNLYSQGISPRLDFSKLSDTVALVCRSNETQLPVRTPYAGELVFSAFAGTHQDAIRKGLDAQAARWAEVDRSGQGTKYWAMPYVPLDPKDLGYGYEKLIRVSSQSGKAGTAHVIKQTMRLDLPRRMQVSFYKVVQDRSEKTGKEMTAELITCAFKQVYFLDSKPAGRIFMHSYHLHPISLPSEELLSSNHVSDKSDNTTSKEDPLVHFEGDFSIDGQRRTIRGKGCGAVPAILDAFRVDLGLKLSIGESVEQILRENLPSQSGHVTFTELLLLPGSSSTTSGAGSSTWGVGISADTVTSNCRAVVSAVNQLVGDMDLPHPKSAALSGSIDNWLPWIMSRAGRFFSERFGWFMVETS